MHVFSPICVHANETFLLLLICRHMTVRTSVGFVCVHTHKDLLHKPEYVCVCVDFLCMCGSTCVHLFYVGVGVRACVDVNMSGCRLTAYVCGVCMCVFISIYAQMQCVCVCDRACGSRLTLSLSGTITDTQYCYFRSLLKMENGSYLAFLLFYFSVNFA